MKMNMLKPVIVSFCSLFLITAIVKAQETQPAPVVPIVALGENVTMKIGGFLRADAYYDTRKESELLDGALSLYPEINSADNNGKDLNEYSRFRMSAAPSRINTKFTGPDFLNAKTSSLVEFDFTGVNGIGFRLRHAWVKLSWTSSELLIGRFWHPMFQLETFPTVIDLNTGAPFNVFNRCEQIRYTYNLGNISLMAAASAQMDYGFPPEGTSYLHNSIMPDITANFQIKNDNVIVGANANYKVNQPRTVVYSTVSKLAFKTDKTISSVAASAYAQFKTGSLKVKASATYGENMMELLMMGGFAVVSKDTTGVEKYASINNIDYTLNIIYGDKLIAGLFVGYMQNLGTSEKNVLGGIKTARGFDDKGNAIDNMLRVSPSLTYKSGRTSFSLEYTYNMAAWGKYDINDHLKVNNTKNVSNNRVLFVSTFYF